MVRRELEIGKTSALHRAILLVVAAESDMRQAQAAAAARLKIDDEMSPLARALDTGMVVSYARAFTRSRTLRVKLRPPNDAVDRATHDDLMKLRHKLHAHTDGALGRGIVDIRDVVGVRYTQPLFTEWFEPIPRADYDRYVGHFRRCESWLNARRYTLSLRLPAEP